MPRERRSSRGKARLRNLGGGDTLPNMSDANVMPAAVAERVLVKIATPGGRTMEALLQAGGAPVGSALLGAGAGAVMAPSDHRGEGAVRGAIAGGLTGLAHRAINARGAVAAQNAANAARSEASVIDHLATQIHGQPAPQRGSHYVDVSTDSALVGGRVVHDKPRVYDPAADVRGLEAAAEKKVKGAGVGGWLGQGTPIAASTAMGGIAGSTVRDDDPRKVADASPFGSALTKEALDFRGLARRAYDALPSDQAIGRGVGGMVASGESLLSGGGLGLIDRLRLRFGRGLSIADAERISGHKAIPLGTSYGTQATPISLWQRLSNKIHDLHGNNAEAARLSRLDQALDLSRQAAARAKEPGAFEQGFGGAIDAARRDVPVAVPGRGGPVLHNVGSFVARPGVTDAMSTMAADAAAGRTATPQSDVASLERLRQIESQMKMLHASAPEAGPFGSALMKSAAAVPHVPTAMHGKIIDNVAGALKGVAHKGASPQAAKAIEDAHYQAANMRRLSQAAQGAGTDAARSAAQTAFQKAKGSAEKAVADATGSLHTAAGIGAPQVRATLGRPADAARLPRPGGAPKATVAPKAPAAAASPAPVAPKAPAAASAQPEIRARARAEAVNPRFEGTAPTPKQYQEARDRYAQADQAMASVRAERDRIHAQLLGAVEPGERQKYQAALEAANAQLNTHHAERVSALNAVNSFHAAEKQTAEEIAKMRAADQELDASVRLPERTRVDAPQPAAATGGGGDAPDPRVGLPGSGAEHNPWSDKPPVDGRNLTGRIQAEQEKIDSEMLPRMGQRAMSGALGGAATGYLAADDEHKGQGALIGGVAGGALGAGLGHMDAARARTLVTRPLQADMHGVLDADMAASAAKELEAIRRKSSTNYGHGAAAGAVASGLTSRGGSSQDQTRTASAEDESMHPYLKIAAEQAAKDPEMTAEKTAGLLERLVAGAGIGGGLGAGAGWVLGHRDPNIDAATKSDYLRRGAILGALAGGAGGALSHQMASHAVNPKVPHPASVLTDRLVGALGAGGATVAGGIAYNALTGSNSDADSAKAKALGTMAAQQAAHAAASVQLAPQQIAAFARVVGSDPALQSADKELLTDAFETMRKAAPRLATDVSAVRSFLREIASYGTGPNYVTIKNLAEAEKALNQTYTAK